MMCGLLMGPLAASACCAAASRLTAAASVSTRMRRIDLEYLLIPAVRSLLICCGIGVFLSVSAGRGGERRAAAVADGSIWPTVPGRGAAAWAGWPGGRQPGARQGRPPLSDRGELSASQ